jgi:hypothetical protein
MVLGDGIEAALLCCLVLVPMSDLDQGYDRQSHSSQATTRVEAALVSSMVLVDMPGSNQSAVAAA